MSEEKVRVRQRGKPVESEAQDEAPVRARGKKKSAGLYDEKESELGQLIGQTRKRMGDHVVNTGIASAGVTYAETGIFALDYALLGGFQESRVNQTHGWEAAGKTTVAMRVLASAQRKHPDMAAVFVDAEGTFDPKWAQAHGVDTDRLVYFQPETGEEAVDIIEASIRAKETCAVALDSIPAIVPLKMIERSAEDPTMAVRAQLMGVACSKMIAALSKERGRGHLPTVLLINQWRRKVGFTMGDNRILPGGDQIRYLCSTMVEIKKKPKVIMGEDKFGNETVLCNEHAFDVDKLKGGSSLRQGEFRMVCSDDYRMSDADKDMPDLNLPAGTIDDFKTVINYGKRMGFVHGGGQSWKIDEVEGSFSKLTKIVEFLVENPDEYVMLKRKLIALKRKENGLPPIPNDGYLLGFVSKKDRKRASG